MSMPNLFANQNMYVPENEAKSQVFTKRQDANTAEYARICTPACQPTWHHCAHTWVASDATYRRINTHENTRQRRYIVQMYQTASFAILRREAEVNAASNRAATLLSITHGTTLFIHIRAARYERLCCHRVARLRGIDKLAFFRWGADDRARNTRSRRSA